MVDEWLGTSVGRVPMPWWMSDWAALWRESPCHGGWVTGQLCGESPHATVDEWLGTSVGRVPMSRWMSDWAALWGESPCHGGWVTGHFYGENPQATVDDWAVLWKDWAALEECELVAVSSGTLTGFMVCFAACSFWQGMCESLWPKDNLLAGMPYHHLPGSLLCFRKFWRSQRKDEVNFFCFHLENMTFNLLALFLPYICLLNLWGLIPYSSLFCLFCRDFAKSITRPFSVYFNPYTQSIEILKDTRSIENVVQDLRSDLNTVCDALNKMNQYLGIWCLGPVSLPAWCFGGLTTIQCHITPIAFCVMAWLVSTQFCVFLPTCNLLW